ncbi:MAG: hypothetical protein M3Z01_02070, partial [Thermoproteota archaeon]|nr:hypothetical protein [Thermoproteota archaeon]
MDVGSNPTADRSKLGTKRYILTDKNSISLSTAAVITSTSTPDVIVVTKVIDNIVVKRPASYYSTKDKRRKIRKQY